MTQEPYIEAARRGDRAAMTALLERYEGLCRKAAGQAHLRPIAEDALAEAREAFLRAVLAYDAQRGVPFPGFAKAQVYGRVRTLFKRARRTWRREILPDGAEDAPPDTRADPSDAIARFESDEAFRAMLAPLGEKPRRLLTMLFADGLSQKEAALRLGVSQQAAAVIKRRALDRLRAQAADSPYESL